MRVRGRGVSHFAIGFVGGEGNALSISAWQGTVCGRPLSDMAVKCRPCEDAGVIDGPLASMKDNFRVCNSIDISGELVFGDAPH